MVEILNIYEPGLELDIESLTAVKERLQSIAPKNMVEWQQISPVSSNSERSNSVMESETSSNDENINVASYANPVLPHPEQSSQEPVDPTQDSVDVSPEMAALQGKNSNVVLDISGFYSTCRL